MSLLSDSPYFVEVPFHSDGWRVMLTRKKAGSKVDNYPSDQLIENARIEDARQLLSKMRHTNIIKFKNLQNSRDWTNRFSQARMSRGRFCC